MLIIGILFVLATAEGGFERHLHSDGDDDHDSTDLRCDNLPHEPDAPRPKGGAQCMQNAFCAKGLDRCVSCSYIVDKGGHDPEEVHALDVECRACPVVFRDTYRSEHPGTTKDPILSGTVPERFGQKDGEGCDEQITATREGASCFTSEYATCEAYAMDNCV